MMRQPTAATDLPGITTRRIIPNSNAHMSARSNEFSQRCVSVTKVLFGFQIDTKPCAETVKFREICNDAECKRLVDN